MVRTGIKRLHHLVRRHGGIEMRNRRAKLLWTGRIHLHVAAWMNSGCQRTACRDDVCADPMEISGALAGSDAFRVGHLRVEFTGTMIFQITRENVIETDELCPGCKIDEGLKAKPVPKFVQNDAYEVQCVRRRIAVETIVPNQRERAGRTDGAIELRDDITAISPGTKVSTRTTICQRLWVPCVRQQRTGEIPMDRLSSSRPERCRRRRAS